MEAMAWASSPNEIGLPTPVPQTSSIHDQHLQRLFQEQLSLDDPLNDDQTDHYSQPTDHYSQKQQSNIDHYSKLTDQYSQQTNYSQVPTQQAFQNFEQNFRSTTASQQPPEVAEIPQYSNVIHYAASQGFVDMLKKMLAANPNELEFVDSNGNTPLLVACINGHYDALSLLLDLGANVNALNDFDNSPVHETAWRGFSRSLELLCRGKAKLYLKNKQGHTALHLAAQKGHNQCTRILLRTGCKPNIKNNFGDTPLHSASRYGHVGVVRILISAFANVNELNRNDDTSLHIAAAMGRKKLAKILLESGCNPTVVNKQGETPMNIALRKEFLDIQEMIVSPPPLKPIHLKQQELYIRPFQGSFKDIYCALPSSNQDLDDDDFDDHHHHNHHRTRSHERRHRQPRHRAPRRSSRACRSDYSLGGHESELNFRRKSPYHDDSDSDEAGIDPEVNDTESRRSKSQNSNQELQTASTSGHFPKPKLETLPSEPLQLGEQYYVDPAGRIHKGTTPGINQIALATILGEPVVGRRMARNQKMKEYS